MQRVRPRNRAVSDVKDKSEEVIKRWKIFKFGGICERKTNTENYARKHD